MTALPAAPVAEVAEAAEVLNVGRLLRNWRERRRISQLELALRADSSARHISFIETGRSRPSRAMVLRLAETLEVPVRERNALLVAAGYAPAYPETPLGAPELGALRTGLETLLTAYEPNPALVMHGGYEVVAANRGVLALLEGVPEHLLAPPMNAMRLTLHPQGLAPRIRNYAQWRGHLLERIERQIAQRPSTGLEELLDELTRYPAPRGGDERGGGEGGAGEGGDGDPGGATGMWPFALPLRIEVGGRLLSFVSTVTTFNNPLDVTVSELAVEAFLPADLETAHALREIAAKAESGVNGMNGMNG